jgi:drug/metabolite transporter (DMT)-like permease
MRSYRGSVALGVTVLIWGSTFAITKVALQEIGPFALSALRFVVAFAMLAPLARRQGYRLRDSLRPTFWRFGLTGVALYYGLQNLGLRYTSAVNTVLVLTVIPAVTAFLAFWWLREWLTLRQVAGIVLAIIGAGLVAWTTQGGRDAPQPLLGNLMIAGSALAWAIYTVQGKRLSRDYPALVSTTASIGAGLLLLLPLGAIEVGYQGWPQLSHRGVLALLYLGVVASALPMFLWNYALSTVKAGQAASFVNLVPVVGVAIALIAGESIHIGQMIGGGLALLGVWLSERAGPRR